MDKDYSFGVVIENPAFMENESAYYNMKYLADIRKNIKKEKIEEALKKVDLFECRNKKVKTFSLGMKQRLGICQAFMEDPDVILLDEPFNALDDKNHKNIENLLLEFKKKNKIVIVVAHGLEDTSMYDKVIKMSDGALVS